MVKILSDQGDIHIDVEGDMETILAELELACQSVLYELALANDEIDYENLALCFGQCISDGASAERKRETVEKNVLN